ncbi:MAG: COX15/CtaA family protein, partial [Candidatus Kapaibacterium sp.]
IGGYFCTTHRFTIDSPDMSEQSTVFRRLAVLTIVSVFLLIAVGSIVRVTGSGMGCPDWPTCFGRIIPPTSVRELPADYKTRWAVQGKEIADFNAFHTWTEYLNRLLGVLIGIFIFATFLASLRWRRSDRQVTLASLAALLFVMFEGWLGAKVVEHDLRAALVTVHYVGALFVVFALVYALVRAQRTRWQDEYVTEYGSAHRWLYGATAILFLQVLMGTRVRGLVDEVAKTMMNNGRDTWLDLVGMPFYVHRSFSILVLLVFARMMVVLYRTAGHNARIITWQVVVAVLMGLEVVTGIVMTYLGIPVVAQPLHLVLSSLLLATNVMLILRLRVMRSNTVRRDG